MSPVVLDSIRHLVGFAPDMIKATGLTRFSTSSRSCNRDGWVRVMPDGVVRFGCWRQGLSGWWRDGSSKLVAPKRDGYAERVALAEEEERRAQVERSNAEVFKKASTLVGSSTAAMYLRTRGLVALTRFPRALRSASLSYFHDGANIGEYPTMVAAVTNVSGLMVALHRTYLDDSGNKAPVPQPKKLSRTSGMLTGASIKLDDPILINGKMTVGVAEGVETALAYSLASGIPTWSCVSAGGVRSFEWPIGLQSLVVFGDNDANGVGQSAASDLAARAASCDLEVRVLIPDDAGSDWLDVYCAGEPT